MDTNLNSFTQNSIGMLTQAGFKILGALALWIAGRILIGFAANLITMAFQKQQMDATLSKYIVSSIRVALNIILIVALLGFFGIETASFAALLAGAGVAIGAAWSGLLANFAAGLFLIFLRPFKTGDFITAAGVTGTVREVGLFVTSINTMDNVLTLVGNNRIFSDTIQNFSSNPYRRVDLTAQLAHGVDVAEARRLLGESVAKIPNVLTEPAPDVEVLTFTLAGPVLAVRPYCNNDHYWQVYFDTNRTIREVGVQASYPAPVTSVSIQN